MLIHKNPRLSQAETVQASESCDTISEKGGFTAKELQVPESTNGALQKSGDQSGSGEMLQSCFSNKSSSETLG